MRGQATDCPTPIAITMLIAIQYLEPGPHSARVSPQEAGAYLHAAFERLPITRVLLGWNLPPRMVDACAEQCARANADLYLWQPLLTADGSFKPPLEWQTIGLSGDPIAGHQGRTDFTFICPNRPAARDAALLHLSQVIASGFYRGVFLDRIRFPSPATDPARQLACFCQDCRQKAGNLGLDLDFVQNSVRRSLQTSEGRRAAIDSFLSPAYAVQTEMLPSWLEQLLVFRQRSIIAVVEAAADLAMARGLKVGLDCYSPSLTLLVGQHLPGLAPHCDWIKIMTYARAYASASIPFEILGLANWLMTLDGESESQSMACLEDAIRWPLPASREAVRHGGLSPEILTEEIRRGRAAHGCQLLAGIELVEIAGVAELNEEQIKADSEAVLAGEPDGVVFSWDLCHIPIDRLELVSSLYCRPTTHCSQGG